MWTRELPPAEALGPTAASQRASRPRPRVAVVYTHFPHYRGPVFDALRRSDRYRYRFFYDSRGIDPTIRSASGQRDDRDLRTIQFRGFMVQPAFLRNCLGGYFDAYVFLGNPYILSTWLYAIILRVRRRKVAFWTHGWISEDGGPKGAVRAVFYRLAHALFLYGSRAKAIGEGKGFPGERLHVIYNSLDYPVQQAMRMRQHGKPAEVCGSFFLCVSRLVADVELELAIEAIAKLARNGASEVQLVVVGDGPERDRLEAWAARCNAPVQFAGPIYDEERLAGLFMNCAAVVSPGKVGLLAIHAMAYGAPVITHDDFDRQMPEVEAIRSPATGRFFRRGDVDSLSKAMSHYLTAPVVASQRQEAINAIEERYTPQAQRRFIERALDQLLDRGNAP